MSFDPSRVDLVALAADGTAELVIVNDAEWDGSDEQLTSFQQKVQTYVSYAIDGLMVDHYPELVETPWRIVVQSLAGEPDERTSQVIEVLATRLPEYGGSIQLRGATQ